MGLKSLLFALLLTDAAAASEEPRRLRGGSEPRLNGTSSDVDEGASTNITKRAAVSNQFNPGPRPGRHEPLSFSRRVSSDEPKPGSRFQRRASIVPSPQVVLIVKMPQAVSSIWQILLLWTPHGWQLLQVGRLERLIRPEPVAADASRGHAGALQSSSCSAALHRSPPYKISRSNTSKNTFLALLALLLPCKLWVTMRSPGEVRRIAYLSVQFPLSGRFDSDAPDSFRG